MIYGHELLQTILHYSTNPQVMSDQVLSIERKIIETRIQDRQANKQHVHHVRERAIRRKQIERALVFPKCGGRLMPRNGRYGKFYGCSAYPNCRYTLPYRTR